MEYTDETITNEEVTDILNKSIKSIINIQEGISKKHKVENILISMEKQIKDAKNIMKNIENEILIEKSNIEEYYKKIKDIHILYTKDRVKIIEDTIRSNIADDIKTDGDIYYGRIDSKEIIENDLYNNKIESNMIYLFKTIMVKNTPQSKAEEKYNCIGTIKVGGIKYDGNKEYNKISIKLENKDIQYKNIYDKYKVYPIINMLNNSMLYKDK